MSDKRVVIVGAGPGGLTAGMLLARRGYQVDVYEKQDLVGGRTSAFTLGEYTFDLGPTFLLMPFILEEVFELVGRKIEDYLDVRKIDPLYSLRFADGRTFFPGTDRGRTLEQIRELFPGNEDGYERFFAYEEKKFEKLAPCLQVPYARLRDFFDFRLIRALPYLDAHRSLASHLGRYFSSPELQLSFTFQAKYLGMSPWECPGTFSMISYHEHAHGVYHPIGGLNQITKSMAKILEEEGGRVHLGAPVKEVLVQDGRAVGVLLESGDRVHGRDVIINADFAHAMSRIVPPEHRKKYKDERLAGMKYSCSTFMLYLGIDKQYNLPHHTIVFAEDYKKNIDEVASTLTIPTDPSIYVQNATATDATMAPEGKSTLYVLVPVPNNRSGIDWEREKASFREVVLTTLEKRAGLTGIRDHIEEERIFTPRDWEDHVKIYRGATFNLAHNVGQMLIWRPHNKFEEFDHCYLVGGGTHPGSGLPTIFESGRITSGLICNRDGL